METHPPYNDSNRFGIASFTRLHINIGANLNPILPPKEDDSVAVLAVEANIGIASHLREKYQKVDFPHRFFVLPCAMAGADRAGSVSTFHFYNVVGVSSSLSRAGKGAEAADWTNHTKFDPTSKYGPGPAAMDYVPVLSLEALLRAVPTDIHIPYLKIDTQGFDFNVIKGASLSQLRRIRRIMSETYLLRIGARRYEINENDLKDWIPYMRKAGYVLTNPPPEGKGGEYDAIWELQDWGNIFRFWDSVDHLRFVPSAHVRVSLFWSII